MARQLRHMVVMVSEGSEGSTPTPAYGHSRDIKGLDRDYLSEVLAEMLTDALNDWDDSNETT